MLARRVRRGSAPSVIALVYGVWRALDSDMRGFKAHTLQYASNAQQTLGAGVMSSYERRQRLG